MVAFASGDKRRFLISSLNLASLSATSLFPASSAFGANDESPQFVSEPQTASLISFTTPAKVSYEVLVKSPTSYDSKSFIRLTSCVVSAFSTLSTSTASVKACAHCSNSASLVE